MAFANNFREEIKKRLLQIVRGQGVRMDKQELAEREEAAQAYAGENEQHFVAYCEDCVRTSIDSMTKIRLEQRECWDVYNEEEPPNYANKEPWQSRVIVPKPFSSVQFSMAIVRKAFDTQFLSIENEQDKEAADFWSRLMGLMLSRNYANFPIQFTDATGMSFAVGQSQEMIPVWRPGKGLRYILVEPWKIHRDPDAISRQPQSGMYWIHQEYLDYWLLKKFEKDGRYINVPPYGAGSSDSDSNRDPNLTKQELARRREQMWSRSGFRTMALTSEFWGTVLDPRGELLLPNSTYTLTGGRVIGLPKVSPYPTLRWPGTSFSALPHLLRFDGRGLIKGIKSLWYFMCSLLCLHADNLNWVVNPPTEIDITSLVDQDDVDNYPGKQYLTHGTVSGQQAIRTVERRSNTNDILANMNFADQRFQEGMMLTYAAQGLPGYRAEITAREAAQNLEQSMTIFSLMGSNLEDGALNAILAGAETVAINITPEELAQLLGPEEAAKYTVPIDDEHPNGLALPQLSSGTFHVSGISAIMRDYEIINNIRDLLLPMFTQDGSVFLPYLKPYALLQSIQNRLNLRDEGIIVDEATAKRIDERQQASQEGAIESQAQTQGSTALQAQHAADNEAAQAELAREQAAKEASEAALNHSQVLVNHHQIIQGVQGTEAPPAEEAA